MDPLIPWAGRSRIRPPRFVHVFLWTELGRWIAPSVIIAGTISLYMATCDGPLLGPDSLVYLSTAESLSATGRAESYFVEPLLHWPPAYPALLAVASVGPFPATVVASLVGAIVFAATGFVLLFHATRAEKGFAGSIMSMLYATSQPMVYVSSYVGSEGLFILACTVVVVGADMYRRTDDWRWLAAGTAAAAIAPLVRYLGVAAIAAGVGILLLPSARQAWARRMSAAVAFAVVSMAPLGLWLLRNLSVSGSLTGPRGDSTLSLSGALGCLGRTLAEWLAYPVSRGYPNTAVAAAVAAVLALAAFHLQSRRRGPDGTGGLVAPYAIFGLAYVGALLWAETRVSVDFPSDRLLSPVAPLMIVWLAVTADRLLTSDQRRAGAGGAWRLAVTVALAFVVACSLVVGLRRHVVIHLKDQEMDVYRYSPRVLPAIPDGAWDRPVFSNVPGVIWLQRRRPVRYGLVKRYRHARMWPERDDIDRILASVFPDTVIAVWSDGYERDGLYTPEEVAARCSVDTLAHDDAGSVLRISGCGACSDDGVSSPPQVTPSAARKPPPPPTVPRDVPSPL